MIDIHSAGDLICDSDPASDIETYCRPNGVQIDRVKLEASFQRIAAEMQESWDALQIRLGRRGE